ncbi:MAG: hypothetical protein M3017_13090 [Actinomycetota bacterium]|nr:hypothetical protein [Actinomycetota bacterium]
MPAVSEFFVANHRDAVAHAGALESGSGRTADVPRLPVPDITDLDVEILGAIAAKAVHAGGIDCALGMVDVELDPLFVVPGPLAAVFAELKDLEDQEDVTAVAEEWAETEEMSTTADVTEPLVRGLSGLAAVADQDTALNLYFWNA